MPRSLGSRVGIVVLLGLSAIDAAAGQYQRVGIIDFYGLRHVTEDRARAALEIREGDLLALDAADDAVARAERRLASLPGVVNARIERVCCAEGRSILYVGIEEQGAPTFRFRPAPRGRIRLPADVVQAGRDFDAALEDALRTGDTAEDHSSGHALMHYPRARAAQERFIAFADRDLKLLRDVLRHSSDPEHRARAAQILGYAGDKRAVVDDLVYAMADLSDAVRNAAMRALGIIAAFAARSPARAIRVPATPFVDRLNSPVWTDRNKASLALMELSANREPTLITALRERALASLIEMARWKYEGHARPAFLLLGRIAGWPEAEISAAWDRRDREGVIQAARKRR
jgi:hypothetical protein